MTIVLFAVIAATAFCNWMTVETLTTVPEGGGSGGAGVAGPLSAVRQTINIAMTSAARIKCFIGTETGEANRRPAVNRADDCGLASAEWETKHDRYEC
jgi:hypothetical protein